MSSSIDATLSEPERASRFDGQAFFFQAFDVGDEIDLKEALKMGAGHFRFKNLGRYRASPRSQQFYPCLTSSANREKYGVAGSLEIRVTLFEFGAASVTLSQRFQNQSYAELLRFHEEALPGIGSLEDLGRRVIVDVTEQMGVAIRSPRHHLDLREDYMVLCIPLWPLDGGEGAIAGLLTGELNYEQLAPSEIQELLRYRSSYFRTDRIFLSWESALISGETEYEDILYLIETANVQLVEMRTLDRQLDAVLERAYRDLNRARGRRITEVINELRPIKIDITKASEELSNITKFYGDWYAARVYKSCTDCLHLKDWQETLDRKYRSLDALYNMASQEHFNRRAFQMEIIIVVLFVVDLLILLFALR